MPALYSLWLLLGLLRAPIASAHPVPNSVVQLDWETGCGGGVAPVDSGDIRFNVVNNAILPLDICSGSRGFGKCWG